MKYSFHNILGDWTIENSKITKSKSNSPELPKENVPNILSNFKDPKYYAEFRKQNTTLTKKAIQASVNEDNLITQAIANISELDKVINILVKRSREWYSLYFPELDYYVTSNEKFVEVLLTKTKEELTKEYSIKVPMGAALEEIDLKEITLLATQVKNLYELRKSHEIYLETLMKKYCPNILELAGVTIGAKLLELGKGLKRLALFPASTVQLLGAEKALFRHIKTGARSPKYGVIFQHPLIQHAKRKDRGKVSRSLADKLSICARLDYFKGEFKAPEYKKQLEEKFNERQD